MRSGISNWPQIAARRRWSSRAWYFTASWTSRSSAETLGSDHDGGPCHLGRYPDTHRPGRLVIYLFTGNFREAQRLAEAQGLAVGSGVSSTMRASSWRPGAPSFTRDPVCSRRASTCLID